MCYDLKAYVRATAANETVRGFQSPIQLGCPVESPGALLVAAQQQGVRR